MQFLLITFKETTKFMSFDSVKASLVIMSVFPLLFLLVLVFSTAKTDLQQNSRNFKDFVTNMINEQSTKIQTLLKRIETNAQTVLEKMENIKETNIRKKENKNNEIGQVESPLKNLESEPYSKDIKESRSFSSHYGGTGFGASGNSNYGTSTYHHHSIGFDPVNIVVSLSLLSFLLQALQGLLGRTRLPTPVVEARAMAIEDWTKSYEKKLAKDKYYYKKKFLKNYY